jgi:class 3 adenylate cyclase
MNLNDLLQKADDHVRTELASTPEVFDVDLDGFDISKAPIVARRWGRLQDVVVVVADLVASTKLGTGKWKASTASIYEAALQPVTNIYNEFDVDHVELQGDCVIGWFWGDRALERGMCAGITVKTFSSEKLVPRLEKKWSDEGKLPATGFKVGVSRGQLLVKRIGLPRTDHQAPVWPGKAVSYAVKAAQTAARHELVVTGSVWEKVEKNDYLAFTCSCGDGPTDTIWKEHDIAKLDHDPAERVGRKLTSQWCATHGEEFCTAVLEGKASRDDAAHLRRGQQQRQREASLQSKYDRDAQRRRDQASIRRAG